PRLVDADRSTGPVPDRTLRHREELTSLRLRAARTPRGGAARPDTGGAELQGSRRRPENEAPETRRCLAKAANRGAPGAGSLEAGVGLPAPRGPPSCL